MAVPANPEWTPREPDGLCAVLETYGPRLEGGRKRPGLVVLVKSLTHKSQQVTSIYARPI